MQTPYLPATDAGFAAWAGNFATLITAVPADYGLVAGDAVALNAAIDPFLTAYGIAINPGTRTPAAVAAKDAARTVAEQTIRPYATDISRNPAVTNADKTAVGVNLPNTARTPVPPPTTQPSLTLVSSVHFQQTLAYRDASTPTSKAKPPGATGLDLRLFIGTVPPPAPDNIAPYGVLTKSPANVGFVLADVGKTATFYGRWITRSGPGGMAQFGPWSAPLAVVVT